MKIAIVGSGGVGGYFGGRLSRAGFDVTFIARGPHLEAMRAGGLEIESPLGCFHLQPVQATGDPSMVGVVDVILFAVKSWDMEQAARAMLPMTGPSTAVISLQNGVEKDDLLRSILPFGYVPGGVCYIASHIARPGLIVHTGTMQRLIFGDDQGRCAALANAFLECCRRSGIDAEIRRDIERAIWEKFVFLVGLSATTSAMRRPIGYVRSHPDSRRLLLEVMQEVVAVARAKGVPLEPDYAEDRLAFCDSLPPEMTSSMHKDLERGNRLELDWLSGSVVRLGEQLGVPTPVNRVIASILAPHAAGARP
jgi:2-dehydropantoate 2-reductase